MNLKKKKEKNKRKKKSILFNDVKIVKTGKKVKKTEDYTDVPIVGQKK